MANPDCCANEYGSARPCLITCTACNSPSCPTLNTALMMQDPLSTKANVDTYLGFDFGNKKIGAAVGQTITATASPLQTIRSINQNPNWEIISKTHSGMAACRSGGWYFPTN